MGLVSFEEKETVGVIQLLGSDSKVRASHGTRIFEHRISPEFVDEFNECLDLIEGNQNIRAVLLVGEGRYFCNGLDLQLISKFSEATVNLQCDLQRLLARILVFSVPTVALLNGHTCAAGAMLALAFDYRILSPNISPEYPAQFFIPALDIGLSYSRGMIQLFKAKLSGQQVRDLIIFGKKRDFAYLVEQIIAVQLSGSSDGVELFSRGIAFIQREIFESNSRGRQKFLGNQYRKHFHQVKMNVYEVAYKSLLCDYEDMGFSKGNWSDDGRVSRL